MEKTFVPFNYLTAEQRLAVERAQAFYDTPIEEHAWSVEKRENGTTSIFVGEHVGVASGPLLR